MNRDRELDRLELAVVELERETRRTIVAVLAVLALLAWALWPSSAAAQVASVCGPGKACSVQRLNVTSASSTTVEMCIGGPQGTADFGFSRTGNVLRLLTVAKPCSSSAVVVPQSWNADTGAITFGSTFYGTGASYWSTNNGYAASLAFASFPACAAGTNGRLLFDSTNNRWRVCVNPDWVYLPVSDTGSATKGVRHSSWSAWYGADTVAEDANFLGPLYLRSGPGDVYAGHIACSWQAAGTGGTNGVRVQIYNVTDSTEVCSCSLGACTTTARTPLSCDCGSSLTGGKTYAMRLTSATDCAANPAGMACNVNLYDP